MHNSCSKGTIPKLAGVPFNLCSMNITLDTQLAEVTNTPAHNWLRTDASLPTNHTYTGKATLITHFLLVVPHTTSYLTLALILGTNPNGLDRFEIIAQITQT